MCYPVNIAKFLRTPVLKNICERLLLSLLYFLGSKLERKSGRMTSTQIMFLKLQLYINPLNIVSDLRSETKGSRLESSC